MNKVSFVRSGLRIALTIIIAAAGFILFNRYQDLSQISVALSEAELWLVFAGLSLFILTFLAKIARWRLLYPPCDMTIPSRVLFSSLAIGQLINLLFPARLGDLARVISLEQRTKVPISLSIGVLIVEKLLDLILLSISLLLVLPFVIVPSYVREQGYPLAVGAMLALFLVSFLSFRTSTVLAWAGRISQSLSAPNRNSVSRILGRWLNSSLVAGLSGISSLRRPITIIGAIGWSLIILILSISNPLILFIAFRLDFGIVEAALLNVILLIGLAPPSTPGKLVVFETLVILTLRQIGLADYAVALSYAIVYHLVIIIPQVVFGGIALVGGGFEVLSLQNSQNY